MIELASRASLAKWDLRFLELAEHIAGWSKGPRKRVGAVLANPATKFVASHGYNGPPPGFDDDAFLAMPREEQHRWAVHAEVNALTQMAYSDYQANFGRLTLYVSPLLPCERCAETVAAFPGVTRVVAYCGQISPDWAASAELARDVFKRHNIDFLYVGS